MNSWSATPKIVAKGIVVVGAGLGGLGIYGAMLYHLAVGIAVPAFACGLVMVVVGRYWIARAEAERQLVKATERQL